MSYSSSVTALLLNVADYGTFGNSAQWQDVADSQSGVLPSVDELTSVHALVATKNQHSIYPSGVTQGYHTQ